jgi:hypothetical protein
MQLYNFKIAEINFKWISNILIPRLDSKTYLDFILTEKATPDILIRINKIKPSKKQTFSNNSIRSLYNKFGCLKTNLDQDFLYCAKTRKRLEEALKKNQDINVVPIKNFLRVIDFNKNILDIFLAGDNIKIGTNLYPCEYFIAANLRLIYSSLLTSFSAFMLHCSSLIMKSGAVLFFAPNEGGKSTTILLSKNRFPILNDDQVIIKREGAAIFAHGTPFGAFNSGRQKAKIVGVFILEKSDKFKIVPASKIDLIQCLWGEHTRYTHFLPIKQKKIAFNLLFDTFHQASVHKMLFQKDFIDWNAIDSAISN